MHIYIDPFHLLVIIPIIATLISLLCAYQVCDGTKAMWWFMSMLFGLGASLLSVIWFVIIFAK